MADAAPQPPQAGQAPAAHGGVNDEDLRVYLTLVNGQDLYDAKSQSLGKLSKDHYLKVPLGFAPNDTAPHKVGRHDARPQMTPLQFIQIYALNKTVFGSASEQIKGALLRAEMVRAGWYTSEYEVEMVAPPADSERIFLEDLEAIKAAKEDASALAVLLPLAAEHTFRTTGHHFLSSLAAEYIAKYANFFNACTKGHLMDYLPPEVLLHLAAHWAPLLLALLVAQSPDNAEFLPNAVVLRSAAPPAGTALVTTSNAILNALKGTGLSEALARASGADIGKVTKVTEDIKENPGMYHTIPSAYNYPALGEDKSRDLEAARAVAINLAPVLQGFVDALPRTSDLTGARALSKYADINPLLRKRAKAFFREVGSTKADTMSALFAMDKRSTDVTGGTEDVNETEEVED